nr:unnamed protein product [Spirometra erinaceieuropaei]
MCDSESAPLRPGEQNANTSKSVAAYVNFDEWERGVAKLDQASLDKLKQLSSSWCAVESKTEEGQTTP